MEPARLYFSPRRPSKTVFFVAFKPAKLYFGVKNPGQKSGQQPGRKSTGGHLLIGGEGRAQMKLVVTRRFIW